ncbi:hypothetical protein F4804DRAFT_330927 [Jackrogersella minutella]|nr:hypothetical protein F4804DRAFT_330927 [Jackrogersella minutella]
MRDEYSAMQLVASQIAIPVAKVVKFGKDERGAVFLELERVDGIELSEAGEKCRKPDGKTHVADGECTECQSIAMANTGLEGFVLPPPRIGQNHERDVWLPKQSQGPDEYVFCHNDLSWYNIMVDPRTLKFKFIYSWEHTRYFSSSIELPPWCCNGDEYMGCFQDPAKIAVEVALIL